MAQTLQIALAAGLAVGYVVLAWRFSHTDRIEAYPAFVVYLIAVAVKNVLPLPAHGLESHSPGYLWFEPIVLVLKAFVCIEVLVHLSSQEGLDECWWRWIVLVSSGLFLASATAGLNMGHQPVRVLERYRQIAHVGMAGFCAGGALTLWCFPLRGKPPERLWWHAGIWSLYMIGYAVPGFINYAAESTEASRWQWYYIQAFSVQLVAAICVALWLWHLKVDERI